MTKNAVDQSVSKLRKILSQYQSDECIKTVYAKGFNFDVKVKQIEKSLQTITTKPYKSYILLTILVAMALFFFYQKITVGNLKNDGNALLLIIAEGSENDRILGVKTLV